MALLLNDAEQAELIEDLTRLFRDIQASRGSACEDRRSCPCDACRLRRIIIRNLRTQPTPYIRDTRGE